MANSAIFNGLVATGDFSADERPLDWRQMITRIFPNGKAPLNALISFIKSKELTEDPEFNWWTKILPENRGTVTNVFTDAALITAYTSGGVQGDTLFIQCEVAVVQEFRVGGIAVIQDASVPLNRHQAKITAVVENGSNSFLQVKLLEADDNGAASSVDISDADTVIGAGNLNAEGAFIPDAMTQRPTKITNFAEIFRNSLDISRTARKVRLRTGPAYEEAKMDALEQHTVDMERQFLYGVPSETVGSNGKTERTTEGILNAIARLNSGNVFDIVTDAAFTAAWLDTGVAGGVAFIEDKLEIAYRKGDMEKMALCGSVALLSLHKQARLLGDMPLAARQASFGMQFMEWVHPNGITNLVTHPLMTQEPTLRDAMVLIEPQRFFYRFIDDTFFKKDTSEREGNALGKDGTTEEYLTEAGFEWGPIEHMSVFYQMGQAGS